MKLLRFGMPGAEKPGCLDREGKIRDLSQYIPDITGNVLTKEGIALLQKFDIDSLPIISDATRLGACVNAVGKFICVGLNYSDHAEEVGAKPPVEPVLFMKATSSICGPNDPTLIPKGSTQTDWEVEIGVVIGDKAKYVTETEAMDYVAGYCLINDVSERALQLQGTGQWMKGKSCDTFGPVGPWLVTRDEIKNPQNLSLWTEVDGKRFQDSHTSRMIYPISFLVSYISRFFTLYPGDIISTGTPAGVGLGQKPTPVYLKAGQIVRLGIDGLGVQEHLMVQE